MPKWNGGVIGVANNPTQSAAKGIWSLSEATKAIRAGLWPPSNAGADPYFENVTLLLPGDGTNGAQNNTFLDSSTNGFTITRNGNTTQGTFSPFSKVDGRWGAYFDGNGDYLTAPSNSAFAVGSTFTIELWLYPISYGANPMLIYLGESSGDLAFGLNGGALSLAASGVAWRLTGSTAPTLNAWNHCVLVRSGTGTNQTSIFLNGTRIANGTVTDAWTTDKQAIIQSTQGTSYLTTGYMSNVRIVKGTAVYDPSQSTLTVPTGPLTAISGTSLLTCQSNRFIDNSTNAFAITRNGDVAVTTFSPFPTMTAYAVGTNGGSGYFDGSGDYVYVASASAQTPFNMGTGDYTTEMWAYFNSVSGYQSLIDYRTSDTTGQGFILYTNGSTLYMYYNGSNRLSYSTVLTNTWYHIAVVKSSGVYALYVNGVQSGSTWSNTDSIAAPANRPIIGHDGTLTPFPFNGYISGTRITKGGALYTSTFTPPTAPPTTTVSSGTVSLLCNFTNGGIIDTSMSNDLETVGNAQISTTQSKFGGASMYFDGTGDYLMVPNAGGRFDFRTGDFTIELWIYSTTGFADFADSVLGKGPVSTVNNTSWQLHGSGTGGNLQFLGPNSNSYFSTTSTPWTSGWAHIAICRSGSNTRLFVNGTQHGSTYTTLHDFEPGNPLWVGTGYYDPNGRTSTCYIDDLRITKGYARYTANFTAPTAPFNAFGD